MGSLEGQVTWLHRPDLILRPRVEHPWPNGFTSSPALGQDTAASQWALGFSVKLVKLSLAALPTLH